ncbi:TPA: hypothetical protein DD394_05035 [bacterium UBP9_UBA11836]|nr:hypothetical protein [bacterium UBP9_UBA11836]
MSNCDNQLKGLNLVEKEAEYEEIQHDQALLSRRKFLSALGTLFFVGCSLGSSIFSMTKLAQADTASKIKRLDPERQNYILPAGAQSYENFHRRCVGCMLCVSNCPGKVLNVKAAHKIIDKRYGELNFSQPAMSFALGYCLPRCTKCSQICPSGAIRPISAADKSSICIGLATWQAMNCQNSQGRFCQACVNACPHGALSVAEVDNHSSRQIMVNSRLCVGCGACEHACPARPYPAIVVNGLEAHRLLP